MAGPAEPQSTVTLTDRLLVMAKTLQFAWFSGHLMLLVSTIRYFLSWIRFNYYSGMARFTYRLSFLAACVTYGLIGYKLIRARRRNGATYYTAFVSLADEENLHHLVMAIVWFLAPQYPLAMIPFFIYSVFHVLSYTQVTIIPTVYPSTTPSPSRTPTHPLAKQINTFVVDRYEYAMFLVVNFELLLWARLFLSALLFQRRSWLLLFIFTIFIRSRYNHSTHMQSAFNMLEVRFDQLFAHQGTPPAVKNGWAIVKDAVRQFYLATDVSKYRASATAPPQKAE